MQSAFKDFVHKPEESTSEIHPRVFLRKPGIDAKAMGEAAARNWLLPLNPQTNRRSRKDEEGPHGGF